MYIYYVVVNMKNVYESIEFRVWNLARTYIRKGKGISHRYGMHGTRAKGVNAAGSN